MGDLGELIYECSLKSAQFLRTCVNSIFNIYESGLHVLGFARQHIRNCHHCRREVIKIVNLLPRIVSRYDTIDGVPEENRITEEQIEWAIERSKEINP